MSGSRFFLGRSGRTITSPQFAKVASSSKIFIIIILSHTIETFDFSDALIVTHHPIFQTPSQDKKSILIGTIGARLSTSTSTSFPDLSLAHSAYKVLPTTPHSTVDIDEDRNRLSPSTSRLLILENGNACVSIRHSRRRNDST